MQGVDCQWQPETDQVLDRWLAQLISKNTIWEQLHSRQTGVSRL